MAMSGGRLALGTVQFGLAYGVANRYGQVPRAEARRIVALASGAGVNTIDTAIGYGDSEAALGEIGMNGFKVVTKLPRVPAGLDNVSDWVNAQIGSSCERLKVAQIDGLLLHRPQDLRGPGGGGLYKALRSLKESGRVRKIGISVYSPADLEALLGEFDVDMVQGPLNLVDRRLHTSGWLSRLKDQGIEIHTRSTFLQGLLLMPRDDVPEKYARWAALWDRWHRWLDSEHETAVAACLAFPLSIAEVDHVLVGADNAEQMRQTLACLDRLPASLPEISSDDEFLINPSNWQRL